MRIGGRRLAGLTAGVLMLVLSVAAPALAARSVRPKAGGKQPPPFPVMAIAEEIRRLSGDSDYAVVPEELKPPAPVPTPAPVPAPSPVPTPAPVPPPEKTVDPWADSDLEPSGQFDEQNDEFDRRFAGRTPTRGLVEESAQSRRQLEKEFVERKARLEKEFNDTKRKWAREHAAYLKRVPQYKATLASVAGPAKRLGSAALPPSTPRPIDESAFMLVSGALDVPVRDQAGRPTCGAFAGIRALEILMQQNGLSADLSEQYFYWASKPDCRSQPCSLPGSATAYGYLASMGATTFDIPSEAACPYVARPLPGNETQVPLPPACTRGGAARVKAVGEIVEPAQLLSAVLQNIPVVVGTRVSENFFTNKGLIDLETASKEPVRASMHTAGHAYVIVGVMLLPEVMHPSEGRYCLVAANSWSEGWGQGGYACVTEKWFEQYRIDMPYLAVVDLEVP